MKESGVMTADERQRRLDASIDAELAELDAMSNAIEARREMAEAKAIAAGVCVRCGHRVILVGNAHCFHCRGWETR